MKKISLVIFVTVTLIACTGNTATNEQTGDQQTVIEQAATTSSDVEAIIEKRLTDIYADAQQSMNVLENDKKYMSQEYNELQNRAIEIGEKIDFVIIDADHWVQGQDVQDPSMSVKSITPVDATHATAVVTVINFGRPTEVTLQLVYERDNWFIDNMQQRYDGELLDEKSWLQDFINQHDK